MKVLLYICVLFITVSCKQSNEQTTSKNHSTGFEREQKFELQIIKFENKLVELYINAEKEPRRTLAKIDSMSHQIKNDQNNYQSQIKHVSINMLDYLKSELFYKLKEYENSLSILEKREPQHGRIPLSIAANYIKLKQYEKAKVFIDKIGKGYYIYDYVLGNYYEVIGNKDEALKIYHKIKKDKKDNYVYYKLALNRIDELNKKKPELLNELYFETGNPIHQIKSNMTNIAKIYKTIDNIPECKGMDMYIHESPSDNKRGYYWIRVGEFDLNKSFPKDFNTEYNFFLYPKNFAIKHYNKNTKELLSLNDWRKTEIQ